MSFDPLEIILSEAKKIRVPELKKAAEELSLSYREKSKSLFDSSHHLLAYMVTRFPATYGVCCHVFSMLQCKTALHSIDTLLDLGSGPGSGSLAAIRTFPSLKKVTLIERDNGMIEWAKNLLHHSNATVESVNFVKKSIVTADFEPHDLVLLCYAMNELSEKESESVLVKAFAAAKKALIIIEPGTPKGFERVRFFRERLIKHGASVIAPCPHSGSCPIVGADWCHFSARIPRSHLHRLLKSGQMGHEDEKFSYIVLSKGGEKSCCEQRVIRHPQIRKGVVDLVCCTRDQGIIKKSVSKKEGALYKDARDLSWGDGF